MGFIGRLGAVMRVMRRKKRPMEGAQLLRRRPALLIGVQAFETALLASGRLAGRIKALARVKTSALVGCPF
jgi:hypothetical protein